MIRRIAAWWRYRRRLAALLRAHDALGHKLGPAQLEEYRRQARDGS